MITCDRCQKTIPATVFQQSFEHVALEWSALDNCWIACLDCAIAFRDGVENIRKDLKVVEQTRIRNWLAEWRLNKDTK